METTIILIDYPKRPKGALAYTVKVDSVYLIFVWKELGKDNITYDAVIMHELIHIALAEKYNKKEMLPTLYLNEIHDDLMKLFNEILNLKQVFNRKFKYNKIFWELWGSLFSYINNDEELLAHLYSIIYIAILPKFRRKINRILEKLNILNKIYELKKEIKKLDI